MSVGNFFAEMSGQHPHTPTWMKVAVWPFLLLVVLFARPKGG